MSFEDCVKRAVAGGEMDPKRAQQALASYAPLFAQFQNSMGPSAAALKAAQTIVSQTRIQAAQKRRVMQLAAASSQRNLQRMQSHRGINGQFSPLDFLQDFISNRRGAGGQTLVGAYEAVRRGFRRELTDLVRTFSANLVGQRRNKETLRNVVREIFGEATQDPAAAGMAKAWATVSEKARTRFNAAGGHIGKRADWGLPQAHDSKKVRRATYERWRDEILPRLDLDAMGMDYNGGVPFTPQTIEILLKDAHDAIRTDGYSRMSPSAKHGAAMYNSRADHRFFKFKTADDWMAYNERFGSGQDAFRVMISHLDSMAMDISLMEQLGPNPQHAYQFLKDAAANMTMRGPDPKAAERVASKTKQADAMFDLHTGATNVPGNAALAKGASAVRQYLTSAHLGSAVISSITDFNTQRMAAKFVGMSQLGFMRSLGRLLVSREFRDAANEAGLIFENAVDMGNAAARFNLEDLHIESAARLADFTIRSSGLGHLTEIQRQAFGMEFMRKIASGNIDDQMRRALEGYGISAADVAFIQGLTPHRLRNGLELVRAQDIEDAGRRDLADLYMEAITGLQEFAVPSTDLFGKALVVARTQPGTIAGEFIRSAAQFKAFPITVISTQISRILAEWNQGRPANAMSYAAHLFVGATLLGAVAIQIKEVSKGRDPRDMTDPKFWMHAMAQGGGLGIFGDFLFSDVNRFGGGIASTLGGPSIGFANDILQFTVGNAQELVMGEETGAGREFVNLLRRYTPGGSLWYARLVYEREILDQLQRVLDPKSGESFRARERGAKGMGTQFFAPPGRSVLGGGARLPDLSNAFGG